MLEDLKPEIMALQGRLAEMEKALDVVHKEDKIAELEYKMGEPTFWDNPEEAQKINQELNDIKISVDKYKALVAKYDDVQVMWEIGMDDNDESIEADVKADMLAIDKALEELQFLFYGPNAKVLNGGENASNYSNPDFDRAFEAMKYLEDGPEKQRLINRMISIMQEDAPIMFGYTIYQGPQCIWLFEVREGSTSSCTHFSF